jgi:predicted amidohydrolase
MRGSRATLVLAIAQMGPVHLADTRASVVARLVEMLREAKARGADVVVFPELALTTFFPRYWMREEEAVERFFEKTMPNPAVQPLVDEARKLGVGFYLGYAELTPQNRRFDTAILVDRIGGSIIAAPTGEIVAQSTSEDDEVIAARIDLALGENFRRHVFNFAEHRRPEHYRLIVERTGAGDPLP